MKHLFPLLILSLISHLGASEASLYAQQKPFYPVSNDTLGMGTKVGILDPKPYFFDGIKALEMNNLEAALEFFSMAHTLVPEQSGINFALAETYFQLGDLTSAAYHAKAAIQTDSTNKWYWLKLANIYRSSGQMIDALEAQEEALALDPKNIDMLLNKVGFLQSINKKEEAILTLERVLELQGPDPSLLLDLYQLLRENDQLEKAIQRLNELIGLVPEEVQFRQELARIYLEQKKYEDAISLFEDRVKKNPNDIGSTLLLLESYFKGGMNEKGYDQFLSLWSNNSDESSRMRITQYLMSLFEEVLVFELKKAVDITISWIQENASSSPQRLAMAIDYLLRNDQVTEALPLLDQITLLAPENEVAWRQYLQLLYTEGNYNDVIEKGTIADNSVPDDAFITFFVGSAHQIEGNTEQALDWLLRSANIPAETSFRSVVYGSLADAHAASKTWDKAFEAYENALLYNKNNDNALNNYAYYLSVSNTELNKAQKMAEKANELRPELASYMDTLGWIYHLQGNNEMAESWILRAVQTGDASATVKEHLGDVYEALGKTSDAKKWWEEALKADPSRTYLQDKI